MGRTDAKVAIVTGAAQGLGAAIAGRLVEEGAYVVIADILEEGRAVAAELGSKAAYMRLDVRHETEWASVIAQAEALFGPVNVLVNNAAISPTEDLETTSEADYRRIVDVNQVGVFLGIKSVIPSMKRAGGGSIVNISSVAGLVGLARKTGYVATKFAVRGMTKSAAIELAKYQIRVNSVHPGKMQTPMAAAATDTGLSSLMNNRTPAGRAAIPVEIANVVVMLASDEARFCTGAEIAVDGGFTC